MRKIIICLGILFLASSSFSQVKKAMLGISPGPSIPIGDFASTDLRYDKAGYAKTGVHLSVDFTYHFFKYFGVAGLWTGNVNPVNIEKMTDKLEGLFMMIDPDFAWEVQSQAWSSGGLLAGPLLSLPLGRLQLDLRALYGVSSSKVPRLDMSATDGVNSFVITQHEARKTSLACNFGGGLRYHFSENLALTANMDNFMVYPEFDVAVTSDVGYGGSGKVEQFINMMNFSIGIGYKL